MMTKSIFNKATPETTLRFQSESAKANSFISDSTVRGIMTLDTNTDATVYVTSGSYAIEFEISKLNPNARTDENVAITHSELETLYATCRNDTLPDNYEKCKLSPVTDFYVQQDTKLSDPEYVIEDSATDINICLSQIGLEQLLILYRMCTDDEHSIVYS